MERIKPDFIARLKYFTSEQGGRKSPAYSGYRPQIKFPFEEMETSGEQIFRDCEIVNPGESVIAEISILSFDYFKNTLYTGLKFEFKEGARIIGTGEIIEIVNKELQKQL